MWDRRRYDFGLFVRLCVRACNLHRFAVDYSFIINPDHRSKTANLPINKLPNAKQHFVDGQLCKKNVTWQQKCQRRNS